jgi:hypothetical protein
MLRAVDSGTSAVQSKSLTVIGNHIYSPLADQQPSAAATSVSAFSTSIAAPSVTVTAPTTTTTATAQSVAMPVPWEQIQLPQADDWTALLHRHAAAYSSAGGAMSPAAPHTQAAVSALQRTLVQAPPAYRPLAHAATTGSTDVTAATAPSFANRAIAVSHAPAEGDIARAHVVLRSEDRFPSRYSNMGAPIIAPLSSTSAHYGVIVDNPPPSSTSSTSTRRLAALSAVQEQSQYSQYMHTQTQDRQQQQQHSVSEYSGRSVLDPFSALAVDAHTDRAAAALSRLHAMQANRHSIIRTLAMQQC